MENIISFISDLSYILLPFIALALLIIAVLIIILKDRAGKILGTVFVLSAISMFPGIIYNYIILRSSDAPMEYTQIYVRIQNLTGLLLIVSFFLILYYCKYRYSVKNRTLIPIFAARIIAALALTVIVPLIHRDVTGYGLIRAYYLSSIISLLITDLPFICIFLRLFYKNRDKEDSMKMLWLYHLISFIFSVLNLICYVMAFMKVTGTPDDEFVNRDMNDTLGVIGFFRMLSVLIIPVYVLIKAERSSKNK